MNSCFIKRRWWLCFLALFIIAICSYMFIFYLHGILSRQFIMSFFTINFSCYSYCTHFILNLLGVIILKSWIICQNCVWLCCSKCLFLYFSPCSSWRRTCFWVHIIEIAVNVSVGLRWIIKYMLISPLERILALC